MPPANPPSDPRPEDAPRHDSGGAAGDRPGQPTSAGRNLDRELLVDRLCREFERRLASNPALTVASFLADGGRGNIPGLAEELQAVLADLAERGNATAPGPSPPIASKVVPPVANTPGSDGLSPPANTSGEEDSRSGKDPGNDPGKSTLVSLGDSVRVPDTASAGAVPPQAPLQGVGPVGAAQADTSAFELEGTSVPAGVRGRPRASASPPRRAVQPIRALGDFRLFREIGRGGMGVVYEAEQTSLRRRVALKLLPEVHGLPPEAVERFERESQILARVQHPGVVEVHWAGVIDGTHCLAMRLIDGVSLDRLMSDKDPAHEAGEVRRNPLFESLADPAAPGRERLVARVGLLAAEALAAVHAAGIVHRDVKPANLMLSSDGSVVLTDFGLAKDLCAQHGLTRSFDYLGTAKYSAPEAIDGYADARSDVFSLGATLRELWTRGGTSSPRDGSGGLAKVLARATKSNPAGRHATAEELAEELRAIAEGREPRDTPPAWRGRVPLTACGIAAVAILAWLLFTASGRWAVSEAPKGPAAATEPLVKSSADAVSTASQHEDAPRLQLISTTRRAHRGAPIEAFAFDKEGRTLIAGGGGIIDTWPVLQDQAARRIADNRGAILRIVRAPSSNRFVAMVAADAGADGERRVVFDFFSLTDDTARRSGLFPFPVPVDERAGFPSFQVVEQADAVLIAVRQGPKLLEVVARGTVDLCSPRPDGNLVAASLSDEVGLPCATLWDNGVVRVESGMGLDERNLRQFPVGADSDCAIHFVPKSERLICAGPAGVRVVDLKTGTVGERISLPGNPTAPRFVAPAGQDRVAVVGERSVALFDSSSPRVLWSAESADSRFIAVEAAGGREAAGSEDGFDDFLLVEANGRVRFVESATGRVRDGERTIRPAPVLVAWSRESRVLATADDQGTLFLYRVGDPMHP